MLRRHTLLISFALALGMISLAPALTPTSVAEATHWDDDSEAVDRVVLRNGRVIEGQILSESDTAIEMLVIVGGISAPATYQRSEILSIERNVEDPAVAPKSASSAPARTTESRPRTTSSSSKTSGAVVYVMTLEGDLGRDITKTPLRRAFDDAVSHDPAVIVVKLDAGSGVEGFDGLWTAEDLAPIVKDVMSAGHRVVFWVERAESGAAFLPLICPEIYFMSDGVLGGLGDLGEFNIGDHVVNLKQISLRLGHAEGIAISGGYEPRLIKAMAIKEEWLAYRLRGGQPEYIDWEPRPEDGEGWIILTDDGKGKNKDQFSFDGNDILTIDADLAFRLLIAKDVIDEIDDLIFDLNLGRDYTIVEGKANQVLKDWRDNIERSQQQLQRLQKDLNDRNVGGRDAATRLGRQINILRQIRGVLSAYEEVFDPNGAQRAQIDVQIEQLRQQIRRANTRR